MLLEFHRRHATLILVAALLGAPLIGYGMLRAYARSDNSVDQWLPEDYETTRLYNHYLNLFGSDETIVVSWVGCTLEDPRLETLAQLLERRADSLTVAASIDLVQQVTTGQRVYAELREPTLGLSRDQALTRLRGVFLGPDLETTCAIVTLSKTTPERRRQAVETVRRLAVEECGVAAEDLRLSGDAVLSVGIDVEGQEAVNRWTLISAALAFVLAWVCLRSLKLAIVVFLVAQYCQGATEAVIYYTGGTMNLLVTLAPVLVYVLSLSACVHLANYYRDALAAHGKDAAAGEAWRAGWWPCLIAALTTGLGLISLCVSHLGPVKAFGVYSSVGMLLGFAIIALLFPAAASRLPIESSAPNPSSRDETDQGARGWLTLVASLVLRAPGATILAFAILFAAMLVGLTEIQTSVAPTRFLDEDSRWISDARWYQDHVGPLASVEIIVGSPRNSEWKFVDRVWLIQTIQANVEDVEHVDGVLSAATFAPRLTAPPNRPVGIRQIARRTLLDSRLRKNRKTFVEQRLLADDDNWELWRITARIAEFRRIEYDELERQLKARIQPILARQGLTSNQVQVTYTGGIPVLFAAQHELLEALFFSFGLAVALIAAVMMIVLRSLTAGLVAMIPNVFPAIATFGIMGWTGTVVDVGAMMTASIGLGIAVDDTMHFLTWHRRALQQGASPREAVMTAFRRCAAAMLHTTLIAGLGLLVFAFSTFQPVSQFGLLMFSLLTSALLGDLVLLPALLASPLGACFGRSVEPARKRDEDPR